MKTRNFLLSSLALTGALTADVAPTANEPSAITLYTFPGFVFQRDNQWVGSDYLYNLQSDIGLFVEILTPGNENLDVSNQKITDAIVKAFEKNRLTARVNPAPGMSALPFIYFQIMAFPTEQGVICLVTGSLFESITIARIPIQKDTALQAITWEKKTMFLSTAENLEDDLLKTVTEIATIFGERWRLFESMKPKTGSSGSTSNLNTTRPVNKILPKPHAAPATQPAKGQSGSSLPPSNAPSNFIPNATPSTPAGGKN